MTFDTLSAAKALKGSGLSDATAEAIVAVVQQGAQLDHLATKADVASVRSDLTHEMEKLETRLKLFVASSVLGGAAMIVLAQVVLKAIGLSA